MKNKSAKAIAAEPNTFALKIIEMQYNTTRWEIEYYLGKMYDVLRLSLALIPLLSGALIALVADQSTWNSVTERPILMGLFCLLSPLFLVVCIYLGNLGIAQFKALTRAANYIKIHFEDYIFQPILDELNKEKDNLVIKAASLDQFLFWENYLSQHGVPEGDNRVRSDYDADKHVMFVFLVFLSMGVVVVSSICIGAFTFLIWESSLIFGYTELSKGVVLFELMILLSAFLFLSSLWWASISFYKFFKILSDTGALSSSIDGGFK